MPDFKLSQASRDKLTGVHPDLVRVVERAIEITQTDFKVVEGVRSLEKQRQNVASKVSRTMKSKHLIQLDGYAHAVDCYPLAGGRPVLNWGKPWPGQAYGDVSQAMKTAAAEMGVKLVWGGDWPNFKDGPHYELG